ncbi:hypothetical protein N7495_000039 [Penicillium taxi]|uniref:uncharacterized protein n=1 Tax=Penicillium taxi TaxID=168475 RepID=UPI00254588F9|nr:uncharacterized protein N7495_000039 [Penicillium taxi]KAJ5907357.1 hypothetical protein N7495_000039 [Penicillium taxi]
MIASSAPVNFTLPTSGSGSSINKPIKTVSKPCFGCGCGDEDCVRCGPAMGAIGAKLSVTSMPRLNATGVSTIIFLSSRLSDRISRMEKLIENNFRQNSESFAISQFPEIYATTSSSPSTSTTSSMPVFPAAASVHFAGRKLCVISSLTGLPCLLPEGQEWVQTRTGQTISIDNLASRARWERECGWKSYEFLMNLPTYKDFELPAYRSVRLYFEAYKASPVMRRIFPVVDADLFEETIQTAYQKPKSDSITTSTTEVALILSFLAFASRLPLVKEVIESSLLSDVVIDQDILASRAQYLLSHVLKEPATLEGAQAVTMMTLYEISIGNMRSTGYFGAIAARLIFTLGGNMAPSQSSLHDAHSQRKQQQLRNIFWICYTMDKDFALRTGQPPNISDENCDLTLPLGYLDRAFMEPENENMPFDQPVFPFDLRLSIIKARTYSSLYSVKAIQKSDAELLKSIRELDDELEDWRLSIPPKWRPTMSFSPTASDPNINMHSLFLRLNYYLCMSLIHQSSSRCKSWVQGGIMDGVKSSLTLSVEASRSTLCYLQAAVGILVDGVLWNLIFYPISALLYIFCSILQNPLDPRSRDDLDQLKSSTVMVESTFMQKLPENEIIHFKLVAEFMNELNQLAECAIEKAWREHSTSIPS